MWPKHRAFPSSPSIPQAELIKLYREAIQAGVPLETIDKKVDKLLTRTQVTEKIEQSDHQLKQLQLKNKLPKVIRYGSLLLPVAMMLAGLFLIGNATFPIMGYFFATLPSLQASAILSPVPNDKVLDVNPIVITQVQASGPEATTEVTTTQPPLVMSDELDYINLSNWFTSSSDPNFASLFQQTEMPTYRVDIPKLKVNNATVTVGGTDLSHSLIQYPGTALPGEFGSPVIFGHSVLRQFYNPSEKNPRRYTSIFSTIMTLKKGDEIIISTNSKKFTYVVQEKTEVKPEDTFILTQKYDARSLKLVTCTPEGTYLRRGVVVAQLVSEEVL